MTRNNTLDRRMLRFEASEAFSDEILEGRTVEHLLGQQLLQRVVLVLQSLQFPGIQDTSIPSNIAFHL